nr:MAG TPA: hypothetical protein [Caudoviricetes sp.]
MRIVLFGNTGSSIVYLPIPLVLILLNINGSAFLPINLKGFSTKFGSASINAPAPAEIYLPLDVSSTTCATSIASPIPGVIFIKSFDQLPSK